MSFLLDKTGEGDLVLTDETPPEEFQQDRYVYLVSRREEVEDRPDLVFRYEDCRIMVTRLTYIYYLLTGRNQEYRGTSAFRTVCFVGGEGGVGVTSLCLSVGRLLSILYGYNSLYLALTPLDGAARYVGRSEGQNLQVLLYQLENGQQVPLGAYIESDEYLDRLRTPVINHYVTEIDSGVLGALMAAIDEMGRYDFVLVDIGTMFAGGALGLLRNSDTVIYVSDDRTGREDTLFPLMTKALGVSTGDLIRVRNMVRERGGTDEIESMIGLCRQAFVWEGDRITIDLNTMYGADVSVLCERIMGEESRDL